MPVDEIKAIKTSLAEMVSTYFTGHGFLRLLAKARLLPWQANLSALFCSLGATSLSIVY